jgi:hypothetical protein
MNPYVGLFSLWGLATLTLAILVVYRSRLTRQESDWIPMTEDGREERAIQRQTAIEKKAEKLTWPIRTLGLVSGFLLMVILAYWLYQGISKPPAP